MHDLFKYQVRYQFKGEYRTRIVEAYSPREAATKALLQGCSPDVLFPIAAYGYEAVVSPVADSYGWTVQELVAEHNNAIRAKEQATEEVKERALYEALHKKYGGKK